MLCPHPIFHQTHSSNPSEDSSSKLTEEVVLAQGMDSSVASEPRLPRNALGGGGWRRPSPALSQSSQRPSKDHSWAPSSWHSGGPRISMVFPSTQSPQPQIPDQRMGLCVQNIVSPSRVGLDSSSPIPGLGRRKCSPSENITQDRLNSGAGGEVYSSGQPGVRPAIGKAFWDAGARLRTCVFHIPQPDVWMFAWYPRSA